MKRYLLTVALLFPLAAIGADARDLIEERRRVPHPHDQAIAVDFDAEGPDERTYDLLLSWPHVTERRYRISQPQDSKDFVLKVSDRPWYFKLSDFDLEGLKDLDAMAREWAEFQAATAAANCPGEFVALPGYEWQGNARWGDHNVVYRREGHPIFISGRTAPSQAP